MGRYEDASAKQKKLKIDEVGLMTICNIIQRGNDAVIRKKGDGYIVLEDKRTIQYQSSN